MGEKKKKNGKNEGEKKSDGGGKKEDGTITVVLKVNMDCDGCVEKVKRSIKGFKGVEAVKRDGDSNKLTVIGKVDPAKLCERVEYKTGKKVELISPAVAKDSGGKKLEAQSEKKNEEKKNKETPVTTVVLKMDLHCEGCIQRIRKIISKKKGVQDLKIDPQKDLVTVKGTMDAKDLALCLTKKMNRSVEIVPAKKEGGGGGGGGGEKKEKGGGGGGGDGGGKKKEETIKTETNLDFYGSYGYPIHPQGHGYPIPPQGHGYPIPPYAYPTQYPIQFQYPYPQYPHAPQLFSDENPNAACSIM